MKQIYYIKVISTSGLESPIYSFNNLFQLMEFIRKNDKTGFSYLITKKY